MDLVKKSLRGMIVALALIGWVCTASASAEGVAPWWGVSSSERPMNMQAGSARDEVQELTVSATGGLVAIIEPISLEEYEKQEGEPKLTVFPYNATSAEVQSALEGIYGMGDVEVGGGPGDAAGSKPYIVKFTGELADRPLKKMNPKFSLNLGLQGTVSVTEGTAGRSDGKIVATVENLGDAAAEGGVTPIVIADRLPAGVKASAIEAQAGLNRPHPVHCVLKTVTCRFEYSLPAFEIIEVVISVVVQPGAVPGEGNEAVVSGGGAAKSVTARRPVSLGGELHFGIEQSGMTLEEPGGVPDTQAGSHPFQLTDTFMFNQNAEAEPIAMTKELNIKLPPGLVGNPTPIPQCTTRQFSTIGNFGNECPADTAIGVITLTINEPQHLNVRSFAEPIFNLEPGPGEPARFGFLALTVPVLLDTSVRTGDDYGVTVSVRDITEVAGFLASRSTFWGVPGDPRHDNRRGWGCFLSEALEPCKPLGVRKPPPFVSLPTSCTGPLQTSMTINSWPEPNNAVGPFEPEEPMVALDGCNHLPFSPSLSVATDVSDGSTPTGLTVDVHVSQTAALDPTGIAESTLKNTTVALPAGVSLNPGAADGLETCSTEQVGFLPGLTQGEQLGFTPSLPSCPSASKIASVSVRTPLLPNPLVGNVYLAAQNANPFGSLFAMYLLASDPVSGTVLKLAGEVKPDPVTGQIVTTFDDTPPLPFEDLELHFFGGDRAPLVTPANCGAYPTRAVFAPWSGEAAVQAGSTFDVTSGPNGSPCASPAPFSPSLTAGTTSIQAGGFSPFTMTVSREDGQQNIQQLQLRMPPGLSGALDGVELCGEAQADAGTCGPNSLIGETTVSVGLGGDPYSVRGGRVYITGPYEGAPFGLSVVVPAKAGPYDLGTVVVRGRIEVNPVTAALTVTTNSPPQGYAIPHILDGIPLEIKHVNFITTRPGFTFNPTDCDPLGVSGSVTSVEGASSGVAVPFQVTNCATLAFRPNFSVATSGKPSRLDGTSLDVKLTYPSAPFGSQANIAKVKVELPRRLPARLPTLQKACTEAQFAANPEGCPAASRVGEATATTPILAGGLSGPAYFVSHGGAGWPELIVVLKGEDGVTVYLHGETLISNGVTSSTFKTVPDVPVGSFELKLPAGRYSALAALGNPCKEQLVMPTEFVAQNGDTIHQDTQIAVTGCPKGKTTKHKQKASRKHGSKRRGGHGRRKR